MTNTSAVRNPSSPPDVPPSRRGGRAPIALVTAAVIGGILLDRWISLSMGLWGGLACGLLAAGCLTRRKFARLATLCLAGSCLAIGGFRHHLQWSVTADNDVSRLAHIDPQPIRLTGIIISPIAIVSADSSAMTPSWMRLDRSMCHVKCEEVSDGRNRTPVTGTVLLITAGHLIHVGVGDRVDVVGQLAAPRGPSNPGVYDYRQYLRRQGIRCIVDCEHPDGVRLVEPRVTAGLSRWRAELRAKCEGLFIQHLDRRTVPLATSLLLGERSQLPDEVRDAFAESGTMHLLAISGLHVGILAGLVLLGCRLLNLSVPATTVVLLIGIAAYALVTNLRPPVVRAGVLAVIVAAGWPAYRRAGAVNVIAACALVVLMINPTDLFDTGTQLSFLAVIAIAWAAGFIRRQRLREDGESWLPNPFARRAGTVSTLVRFLAEGYVVTTAIWLFTLPLTAAQFHIAAPVGFVVNVLLIPYVAVILTLGFGTLACGFLLPGLTGGIAMLFNASLNGLLHVVDAASALHLGHVYLAGPPFWWLLTFYGLLVLTWLFRDVPRMGHRGWVAVIVWVIAGQLATFSRPSRDSLRCTFLDVGHGCCALLELPGGENLLYDAGMFAGQRRGRQIIQSVLWSRGISRLDGIVVSHADVDHFNVCGWLMATMPVGSLMCSRTLLDFEQAPVGLLCEEALAADVPIRLLQTGDRLATSDRRVAIDVLHPADGWSGVSDNANSVVLRVQFAGRSILLTGDLEGDGLANLLHRPAEKTDVLLAPHHGGRTANPSALGKWADPEFLIVSGGDRDTGDRLRDVYPDARDVLCTHDDGAITVEVSHDGGLSVAAFLGIRD